MTWLLTFIDVILSFSALVIFFICLYRISVMLNNSKMLDIRNLFSTDFKRFNAIQRGKIIKQVIKSFVLCAFHLARLIANAPDYPSIALLLLITFYTFMAFSVAIDYLKLSR